MFDKIIDTISSTPVMINLFPQKVEPLFELIDVLVSENYTAIELLARPFEACVDTLTELNKSEQRKKILVGVGTIKTQKSVEAVVELKPDFIVSPTFSRKVFDVAFENDVFYLPAVCTMQDVQNVLDAYEDKSLELKLLKLCPVEILSYKYVEMLGTIFPDIKFCPTGTVTLETLPEWKKISCIGPAMESSFVPQDLIDEGRWDEIRQRLRFIKSRGGHGK